MAGQLIATKLYTPTRRRGLVARPRLLEALRRGADARLVLVSAPAGFGKTTLLADWLDEEPGVDRRVAWLSLDPADAEPVSFWSYVVTALAGAVPGVGPAVLELVRAAPMPTDLMLTTLVNALTGAEGQVWLVLDDYHLVDNPEIGRGLAFLLQHLPPHVHVVLSTRADPDLPLARWRMRGELVEIRAADLRFTSDEAAAYLGEATGQRLTTGDVQVLEERTEGWIAALQLAALSLRGRADVSGFIDRFAGDDRYLVDYLVEEVLAHQPASVRDFLLRTAVLDRLTGSLCDAVVGGDDGDQMLLSLERANLFLVPLDDQRTWFRYHHLFADVLRARLLAEQPDLVPLLHQRASRWHEEHDAVEEAVRHALAANDVERAAYLMELAIPAIRRNRQEAMLPGWLQALPDEVVRRRPVLGVFDAYLHLAAGDLEAVEPRLAAAERALAAVPEGSPAPWPTTDELDTLPATIEVYRASLAQARGDVAGTTEHARRAFGLARPGDHLVRGAAAGFLGLAAWAQGDVVAALETFTQAVASLHAAGNLVDELSSTAMLADMNLGAGRPITARRLYLDAIRTGEAHGAAALRAMPDLYVGLSGLDHEGGDLPGARRHLDTAAALAERGSMTESRYRWFAVRGRVAAADGEPEEAEAFLDQAEQLYRAGFFPDLRPVAAARARLWIAQGRLSEAAAWAQGRGLSTSDDAVFLTEYEHLTLVRLIVAQHRARPDDDAMHRAVGLLSRLREAAERSGRAGSLVEIDLLLALAHDTHGRRLEAREALERALTDAPEPEGYARTFVDEGAPLLVLLRDARDRGVADPQPSRLLALAAPPGDAAERSRPPDDLVGRTHPAGAPLADPLSARELQVLRLLDSELSGPQIAGELFVSHNTLRTHTKHIFTKLDVTNRRAAVRRARELGLM
ncbi:MAG TPA: LuxR C-terminal-related transcriptional regulator [Actinotalea sp.]